MSLKYLDDQYMIIDFIRLYQIISNESRSNSDRIKAHELQKVTLELLPYPETYQETEIRDKMKEVYLLSKDKVKDIKNYHSSTISLFSSDDSLPKTNILPEERSNLDIYLNSMNNVKKEDKPTKEKIRATLSEIRKIERQGTEIQSMDNVKNRFEKVAIFFKNSDCPQCKVVDKIWKEFIENNSDSDIRFVEYDYLDGHELFEIYNVNYPALVVTEQLPIEYELNYDVDLTDYNLLPFLANDNKLVYREMYTPFTYDNLQYMIY